MSNSSNDPMISTNPQYNHENMIGNRDYQTTWRWVNDAGTAGTGVVRSFTKRYYPNQDYHQTFDLDLKAASTSANPIIEAFLHVNAIKEQEAVAHNQQLQVTLIYDVIMYGRIPVQQS